MMALGEAWRDIICGTTSSRSPQLSYAMGMTAFGLSDETFGVDAASPAIWSWHQSWHRTTSDIYD